MVRRFCEDCNKKLSQHEVRLCRRCRCLIERAKWLHQCGVDMDRFEMQTTGSKEIDAEVQKYR